MGAFASFDWRRALTIIGVLLVAFGCGYVMQNVLAADHPYARTEDGPAAAPVLRRVEEPPALPVPPAATLAPIRMEVPPAGPVANDPPVPRLPGQQAALQQGKPTRG